MHLCAQCAHPKAGKPSPPPPRHAPGWPIFPIPSKSPSIIVELHTEITALYGEVQALHALHVASHEAPLSPCTTPTIVPPHSPSHSSSLSSMSIVQECTTHPQHQWLQGILDYLRCPTSSANPLFQDSTDSNYHNSTVFDSAYSTRYHRVPVPQEPSTDTVHLQYVLHKVTSQNFSMVHVT